MNQINTYCVFATLILKLYDVSIFTQGSYKCKFTTPHYVDHFYLDHCSQFNKNKNKIPMTIFLKVGISFRHTVKCTISFDNIDG